MELISIGFVHSNVSKQYGKHQLLKNKINKYFSQFVDKYREFEYVWLEDKLYVESKHGWRIKKDIEKLLNKEINQIDPKIFPPDFMVTFIDALTAKRKIEQKNTRKRKEKERRKRKAKNKFSRAVKNIKNGTVGFNRIGCFDLEFWEQNMNILLEFGWRIEDYKSGKGETVHLIVQENLNYKNGFYSKNNRFARKDSKVVPKDVAKRRFKEEFIDKIDLLVGHGLTNDFKVLKSNGINFNMAHLDTSEIGAAMMDEDERVSLERLLQYLHIDHDNLHNAANDVEFILKAFFEMGDL